MGTLLPTLQTVDKVRVISITDYPHLGAATSSITRAIKKMEEKTGKNNNAI